ncbi:MAG: hypothetical protein ACYTHJ_14100, partial [Planctomycetota bacterium]
HELDSFADLVQAIYMIPAWQEIYLQVDREKTRILDYHFLGEHSFADTETETYSLGLSVTLARNIELGELPEQEEPNTGIFSGPPRAEESDGP